MKFQVTIVGHGAEALEFLNDSDNSSLTRMRRKNWQRFLCYIQFLQFIKNRHLVIP